MWTTLCREQKVAFSLLVILGISGLILGILYFQNRVQISLSSFSKENLFVVSDDDSFIALQNKDTDRDGLSDYDETYFYGTSPYLEDTDSDGYLDKEEIEEGEDPNCVRGKSCGGAIMERPNAGLEFLEPAQDPGEMPDPMEAVRNINISELRSLLQGAGLPDDILMQISDQELDALYQDTIKQTEGQIQE